MYNNTENIPLNVENNLTQKDHHKHTKSQKNYINKKLQRMSYDEFTRKPIHYNVSMITNSNQETYSPSTKVLYKRIYSNFTKRPKNAIRSFTERFLPMGDFRVNLLNYNEFVEIRGHVKKKANKTFVRLTVSIQKRTWIVRLVPGGLFENLIKMVCEIVDNNICFNSKNVATVLLFRVLDPSSNRSYLSPYIQGNRCLLDVFKDKLKSLLRDLYLINAGALLNFIQDFDQYNTDIVQTLPIHEPWLGTTITTSVYGTTESAISHGDCSFGTSTDLKEITYEALNRISNVSYLDNNANICNDMSRGLLSDRYQLQVNNEDTKYKGLEIVLSDKYNLHPNNANNTAVCANNDFNTPADSVTDHCELDVSLNDNSDSICEKQMIKAGVRAILSNKYTLRPCDNRDIDAAGDKLHFIMSDEYQLRGVDTSDMNMGDYEICSDDAVNHLRTSVDDSEEEKRDSKKIKRRTHTYFTYSSSASRRTNLNTRYTPSNYIQNTTRLLRTRREDVDDTESGSDTNYLEANKSPGELA